MTNKDKDNLELLRDSLNRSNYNVIYEDNERETESLYRFGWFYVYGYKYSVSGWSFQKQVVTFENEIGEKIKYSIPNKITFAGDFTKDGFLFSIQKKLRNNLADWLKDLSDKLRT